MIKRLSDQQTEIRSNPKGGTGDVGFRHILTQEAAEKVNLFSVITLLPGQSIGLLHLTPWEATVVAADVAMKSGTVELGFLDRFSGAVILLGSRAEVKSALEHVVEFFRTELGFTVCEITER